MEKYEYKSDDENSDSDPSLKRSSSVKEEISAKTISEKIEYMKALQDSIKTKRNYKPESIEKAKANLARGRAKRLENLKNKKPVETGNELQKGVEQILQTLKDFKPPTPKAEPKTSLEVKAEPKAEPKTSKEVKAEPKTVEPPTPKEWVETPSKKAQTGSKREVWLTKNEQKKKEVLLRLNQMFN